MYDVQFLTSRYFKIFQGVYEDFRNNSHRDYKFEIEPLEYKEFIEYFEKGIIQCLILLEDGIPTGFLAFSSADNLALELFVIHLIGEDDLKNKVIALSKEFLVQTVAIRTKRIASYPMLGKQKKFKEELKNLGFNFVDLGVMVYDVNSQENQKKLFENKNVELPIGFKLVNYSPEYFEGLTIALNASFEASSDVNYDERFLTISGCVDIAKKITESIYGDFLSRASKLLIYEDKVVGFSLANITAGTIANIPLVGIMPEFRGQKLSEVMLGETLKELAKMTRSGELELTELNVTVDLANLSAYSMYKSLGFNEIYMYPQAYMPKTEIREIIKEEENEG